MKIFEIKITDIETGLIQQTTINAKDDEQLSEIVEKAYNKCLVEIRNEYYEKNFLGSRTKY